MTLEIPVDNVSSSLYDNISRDEKLKSKYSYQKFKQTLEEEINKADNQ